jgi:hypothetical protein
MSLLFAFHRWEDIRYAGTMLSRCNHLALVAKVCASMPLTAPRSSSKEQSSPRSSRVAGFTLTVLGVLCAWWVFERMRAIAILDREEAAGLRVDWEVPAWAKKLPEKSLPVRLWPGTHIDAVVIQGTMADLVNPAALGRAMEHFGSVERIYIKSSTPDRIATMLQHMGHQPKLVDIDVEEPYHLNASIYPALARFTGLKRLYVPSSTFDGEGFPKMPLLDELTVTYTPITDQGLHDILSSCPKLEYILLDECNVSPAGVISVLNAGHPNLRTFGIRATEFSDGEVLEIVAQAKRLMPHLKLEIGND